MNNLNPRQQEAAKYIDGPLLVLAGAGSGKTSVITKKIALPNVASKPIEFLR
jgi:ATP-dependent DNA helicase Rep